jgi:hypothetical protein
MRLLFLRWPTIKVGTPSNQAECAADALESGESAIEVRRFERGAHLHADSGGAFGYDRKTKPRDENAFLQ